MTVRPVIQWVPVSVAIRDPMHCEVVLCCCLFCTKTSGQSRVPSEQTKAQCGAREQTAHRGWEHTVRLSAPSDPAMSHYSKWDSFTSLSFVPH